MGNVFSSIIFIIKVWKLKKKIQENINKLKLSQNNYSSPEVKFTN